VSFSIIQYGITCCKFAFSHSHFQHAQIIKLYQQCSSP
jgi:hypothetical protein